MLYSYQISRHFDINVFVTLVLMIILAGTFCRVFNWLDRLNSVNEKSIKNHSVRKRKNVKEIILLVYRLL